MYNRKQLRRFTPGGINDAGSWDFPDGNFNFDMNLGNISDPYDVDKNGLPDNVQSNSVLKKIKPGQYNTNYNNMLDVTEVSTNPAIQNKPFESIVPFSLDTPDKMPILNPSLIPQSKPNSLVAVKSRPMSNRNPEKMVNKFNAAARGTLGMINNFQNRAKEQAQILKTVNPANFVATQFNKYRGAWTDFGHKTGLQAYDQQGSNRNSYSTYGDFGGNKAQLGGFLADGGVNSYKIGDQVTMSIPDLEAFLAAGGEVDYI